MAEQIDVKVAAQIAEFSAAMKQVEGHFASIGGAATALAGPLKAVGEAFAAAFAVEKIKQFAEAVAEAGQRVVEMSHELGMSIETVSQLGVAFQTMGMSSESAGMALVRLERNMSMAEQGGATQRAAFLALGISIKDLKEMAPDEVIARMAEAFQNSADGPEKTAIAMALLGRQGASMIPFLDRGKEGMEEFKRIAQETGTVLTKEMAEGMEQTALGFNIFGLAGKGVGITLFEAVKPAIDLVVRSLTDMLEGFNESIKEGGALRLIFMAIVETINVVVAGFLGLKIAVTIVFDIIGTAIRQTVIAFNTMADILEVFPNPSKMKEAAKRGFDQWADEGRRGIDKVLADARKGQEELINLFSGHGETFVGGEHKGGEKLPGMEHGDTRLAEWKAELDQKRDAEGAFRQLSKADEVKYWQERLAVVESAATVDEKLQRAVLHEIAQAKRAEGAEEMAAAHIVFKERMDLARNDEAEQKRIQDAKVALALAAYGKDSKQYEATILERQKLDEAWVKKHMQMQEAAAKGEQDLSLAGLAMAEAHAKALFETGKMTQAQLEQSEREGANTRLAIELDFLTRKRALQVAGNDSPINIQATDQAILVAKQANAAKLVAIDDEASKRAANLWAGAVSTVTNSFDQMLSGVLHGTQTWEQAMARLFVNLGISFVTEVAKMSIQWLAFQAGLIAKDPLEPFIAGLSKLVASFVGSESAMSAAKTAGEATRTAATTGASAQSVVVTKMTAASEIASWAATAAVEAMASVAAIPFYGWAMAPEVGAATYADAMSYEGLAALDVGTNYVPRDMTVRIHEGEAVVPKAYNPAAGGADSAGGVHFHIQAVDGQSVSNMLRRERATIYNLVASGIRNNAMPGMSG